MKNCGLVQFTITTLTLTHTGTVSGGAAPLVGPCPTSKERVGAVKMGEPGSGDNIAVVCN